MFSEVHSSKELKQAIENIRRIKNVDEVAKQLSLDCKLKSNISDDYRGLSLWLA